MFLVMMYRKIKSQEPGAEKNEQRSESAWMSSTGRISPNLTVSEHQIPLAATGSQAELRQMLWPLFRGTFCLFSRGRALPLSCDVEQHAGLFSNYGRSGN